MKTKISLLALCLLTLSACDSLSEFKTLAGKYSLVARPAGWETSCVKNIDLNVGDQSMTFYFYNPLDDERESVSYSADVINAEKLVYVNNETGIEVRSYQRVVWEQNTFTEFMRTTMKIPMIGEQEMGSTKERKFIWNEDRTGFTYWDRNREGNPRVAQSNCTYKKEQ